MAGGIIDSLLIAVGLDTSQIAQGVQQVGAQLDSGLSAAAQSAATKMSPLGEALRGIAEKAGEGVRQIAEELENGLQGAVESVEPAIDGMAEGFAAAAEEASGLAEAATGAGEAVEAVGESATSAGEAGAVAGRRGQQAARDVGREARNTAQAIRTELPAAARQAASGIDSAFSRVKESFKGFIAQILGPMAGAFAIGGAVSTFINGAMAAEDAGQAFNVSAEELQLWQGAITRAGGSVSKFEMSLRKMMMSGKSAGDSLKTLHDLAGQAEKMSREAFTAKAKELGIDAATIGVLAQGQKALDAHLKRAKEIGIYEKRHIEQAKRLKIGIWELGGAFDGLKNELLLMVLPAMEKLLGLLTDITLVASEHAPLVAAAIGLVGAALAFKLLPPLKTLPGLIMNAGKAFLRWMPFVAIIAGIAMMIDDLYAYMTGGNSRFKELWSIFGTGPEVMAKVTNAWKDFKKWGEEVWEGIKTKAKAFWDWMDQWGVLDGIANAFQGLAHIVHGFFSDSEDSGQEMWDGFVQLFGGLFDIIAAPFRAAGEWLGTALSDGIDALEASVAEGVAWIADGLSGIADSVAEAVDAAIAWVADGLSGAVESAESAIAGFLSSIWTTVTGWVDRLKTWVVEKITGIFSSIKVPSFLTNLFGDSDEETEKAGGKIEDGMAKTAGEVEGGFNAAWQGTKNFAISTFQGAATSIQGIFSGILAGIDASAGQAIRNAQAMAGGAGMVPAPVGVRAGAGARGGVSNTSNVHIGTMNVQTRATDANGMAKGAGAALQRNQLVRAGQSGTVSKG